MDHARVLSISHKATLIPVSAVGMATGYGLDGRVVGVRVPPHVVQTGSGAHSASYPMGTEGFFLWNKTAEV
jgi:hypothetical protein